jgi:hypothetical protein
MSAMAIGILCATCLAIGASTAVIVIGILAAGRDADLKAARIKEARTRLEEERLRHHDELAKIHQTLRKEIMALFDRAFNGSKGDGGEIHSTMMTTCEGRWVDEDDNDDDSYHAVNERLRQAGFVRSRDGKVPYWEPKKESKR